MEEKDLEIIRSVCTFLDDRKAEDIVVLDLRETANIADHFVIATGANKPHLKALYDGLQRLFKDSGFRGAHRTGSPESGWMIMDYYGVMVHLFDQETRDFYNLEEYWKDARRVLLNEEGA
jgi:ribosome-associated protein